MKIKILVILVALIVSWLTIANIIQAFKCTKMSQTELFIHIPKSVMCNWTTCK